MNNEPAFPCECSFYDGNVTGKQTGTCHGIATGLTKREYFAAMVETLDDLQTTWGMISSDEDKLEAARDRLLESLRGAK